MPAIMRTLLPAALIALSACAAADRHPHAASRAVDHRLPWTAGNLKTVGEKCHFPGIPVDARGIQLDGLSAIGETPPDFKRWDCVSRNIQVPAYFSVVSD